MYYNDFINNMGDKGLGPVEQNIESSKTSGRYSQGSVKAPDLRNILLEASKKLGGLYMMEAYWGTPDRTLKYEVNELQDTLSSINESTGKEITLADVQGLKVCDYLEKLYPKIATGSCGNTASVIEEILCGESNDKATISIAPNSTAFANFLLEKVKNEIQPWYCRVECGGHSFQIEFQNDEFLIYQSFSGGYTLAEKLTEEKKFSPKEFANLMEVALSPNPIKNHGNPTREQNQARIELFHERALHPGEINYRMLETLENNEVQESLNLVNQKYKFEWENYFDKPMAEFITDQFVKWVNPKEVFYTTRDLIKTLESKQVYDEYISNEIKNIESLEIGATYTFQRFGCEGYVYQGVDKEGHKFEKAE